jgi:hypothetical protein
LFKLRGDAVGYNLKLKSQGFGKCLIFETGRNDIGLSSKPRIPVLLKCSPGWFDIISNSKRGTASLYIIVVQHGLVLFKIAGTVWEECDRLRAMPLQDYLYI